MFPNHYCNSYCAVLPNHCCPKAADKSRLVTTRGRACVCSRHTPATLMRASGTHQQHQTDRAGAIPFPHAIFNSQSKQGAFGWTPGPEVTAATPQAKGLIGGHIQPVASTKPPLSSQHTCVTVALPTATPPTRPSPRHVLPASLETRGLGSRNSGATAKQARRPATPTTHLNHRTRDNPPPSAAPRRTFAFASSPLAA